MLAKAPATKLRAEAEALLRLERFLLDLVTVGLGGLTADGARAIAEEARRLGDLDVTRGAAMRLRALAPQVSPGATYAGAALTDDLRAAPSARLHDAHRPATLTAIVTELWALARRGRRGALARLAGAEATPEDAYAAALLGRPFRLTELAQAGYWVKDRALIELADERTWPSSRWEASRGDASATGYLLDLDDGAVVCEWTSLPERALRAGRAALRPIRQGVILVEEAALYPGSPGLFNRRIRWDDKTGSSKARERPRADADYARLHALAGPVSALVAALRAQRRHVLGPREAVGLVAVARFQTVGRELLAVDPEGTELVLRDPPEARYPTTDNLRRAAAAFGAGSLAVRLSLDRGARAFVGQPLALVVGAEHLRLGL
jgi:hypothetical protein